MALQGQEGSTSVRASLYSHQAAVGLGRISPQDECHVAVRKSTSIRLIFQPALGAKVAPFSGPVLER